jgi:hypothetical protein
VIDEPIVIADAAEYELRHCRNGVCIRIDREICVRRRLQRTRMNVTRALALLARIPVPHTGGGVQKIVEPVRRVKLRCDVVWCD